VSSPSGIGLTYKTDSKGRSYITGLAETRKKLLALGMERNEFESMIKQAAIMVAAKAVKTAPVLHGRLAASLRGQASKKWSSKGVTKTTYGGVVLGRTPYARRVSYGAYTSGIRKITYKGVSIDAFWNNRSKGNPYMVRARESMKRAIVSMFNQKTMAWIRAKGFETNGL
jgi:hypothetical protein